MQKSHHNIHIGKRVFKLNIIKTPFSEIISESEFIFVDTILRYYFPQKANAYNNNLLVITQPLSFYCALYLFQNYFKISP